jgi:hypothetical protein
MPDSMEKTSAHLSCRNTPSGLWQSSCTADNLGKASMLFRRFRSRDTALRRPSIGPEVLLFAGSYDFNVIVYAPHQECESARWNPHPLRSKRQGLGKRRSSNAHGMYIIPVSLLVFFQGKSSRKYCVKQIQPLGALEYTCNAPSTAFDS